MQDIKPYFSFSLYAHSDRIYAESESIYVPSESSYAPSERTYAPSEPIMPQVSLKKLCPKWARIYAQSEPLAEICFQPAFKGTKWDGFWTLLWWGNGMNDDEPGCF